ncbi:MAG: hypothetical protein R3F61_12600 [Myxococcota bacterium]
MLLLAAAMAADVQIVGSHLQLVDHFPRLRAELGGDVVPGTALKQRDTTVVYVREGADAKAVLAKLPAGTSTEPLTWKAPAPVVIALGDDLTGPAPAPTDPVVHYSLPIRVLGFSGTKLVWEESSFGCCDSPLVGETSVWVAEAGKQEQGFLTKLDFGDQLASVLSDVPPHYLQPPGRPKHLAAAVDLAALGPAAIDTPPEGVTVALSARGRALEPTDTGWAFPPPDACEGGPLVVTVVVTRAGTPARATVDLTKVLCDNQVGALLDGTRLHTVWSAEGHGVLWADTRHPFDHRQLGMFALP